MSLRRVNRIALDGTTVSIVIATNKLRCSKQGYGDSLTIAKGSRLGSQEQDYQTSGSYKTDDISFTVEALDYREYLDTLPSNGFGNKITVATILYEHPDLGSTFDVLDGFRFLSGAMSAEAGEKMLEHEIKASCMQIYWGDKGKTLNYVKGRLRASGTSF
jgi:hypothetical protein